MEKRLPVEADQLELGKPLPWDVYDTHNHLLLRKGYVITRESQLQVLAARGIFVDSSSLRGSSTRRIEPNSYDAFRVWDYILDELDALLRNVRVEPDFQRQLLSLARLVQQLAERSPDGALAAMILTDQRRYPIIHSLHTAVLCELVARRLEWVPERRTSLACAAMTMNLAMVELQQLLCSQRRAPTPEQRREIQRHPSLGEEMLREAGITDEIWLAAVRDHHERAGGGGYPFGITAPGEEARLIQTADIFSAKVSPRAARAPVTSAEAARSLFIDSGNEPNIFAAALVKEIGIFPPGTCVALANGETGIVHSRGKLANAPMVISLASSTGLSYGQPLRRDTSNKEFEIRAVVPRDKMRFRIRPEQLWR
ncbi:MAG: HD domain-containing phosphohydrolase [Rhodocyclaceae bacterium]